MDICFIEDILINGLTKQEHAQFVEPLSNKIDKKNHINELDNEYYHALYMPLYLPYIISQTYFSMYRMSVENYK